MNLQVLKKNPCFAAGMPSTLSYSFYVGKPFVLTHCLGKCYISCDCYGYGGVDRDVRLSGQEAALPS